ncbi:MAG: hypothetical protein HW380_1260 [Magnetococcales bacterium]|nr:hypothetical protein [Magnetococcales bacterium]HIJ84851.1 hypothetical protein [Magnetococcales bacterium]
MEFPSPSAEALALENTWLAQAQPPPRAAKMDLTTQIAVSLRLLSEDLDDPLLHLPWFAWRKRRLFMRYRVAINALLWYWALREVAADRAHTLLQLVAPLYTATRSKKSLPWRQIMSDLDFFLTILDNYREEGFLSVAQHVVWRVHGDFTRDHHLLENAVSLAFYMDKIFDEFRFRVYQWAGREPPASMDRLTGLLDDDAFSGNF